MPQPSLVELVGEGVVRRPTILDVGCGAGENAPFFAGQGYRVTGVDLSRPAVDQAAKKGRETGIDAECPVHDALRLGALARRLDTVIDFCRLRQFHGDTPTRNAAGLAAMYRQHGQLVPATAVPPRTRRDGR